MRKLTVKMWFTIAALFLSATVSAADCSSNANQCTPKQLCSAATSTEGGVKVWSKSSYYSKHVSKAKQVGINCGVVEIVASCDNDPELCSVDDLCKQSVQKSGGKTVWKSSSKAAKHIALAKEFGLKCGVTSTSTTTVSPSYNVKKKFCSQDSAACNNSEICMYSTWEGPSQKVWSNQNRWNKHVTEAKRRGLSCGVTSSTATTAYSPSNGKKKYCSLDSAACNNLEICMYSTWEGAS